MKQFPVTYYGVFVKTKKFMAGQMPLEAYSNRDRAEWSAKNSEMKEELIVRPCRLVRYRRPTLHDPTAKKQSA
jgi:hypothetical protein